MSARGYVVPWQQRAHLPAELAAQVIGISRRKLYQRIREGHFTPRRDGRTLLIPVAEIHRYLARLEHQAENDPEIQAMADRAYADLRRH